MSFRAPELYDVQTGTTLDEKVDIWVSWFGKSAYMEFIIDE
jgi:hypothetical protein